jgi:putative thioredoxin
VNTSTNGMDVNEATFQQDVLDRSRQLPVMVDFWAPWCGPCRMLSPTLERVTEESNGAFTLVKINVDDNPNVAARYGVQGIPAVKVFRDGQVAGEFVGAVPESQVREFVKKFAPSKVDGQLAAAQALVEEERWPEAETLYRNILEAAPDQAKAKLEFGKLLLRLGNGREAESTLKSVPGQALESVEAETLLPLARLMISSPNGSSQGAAALYHAAGEFFSQQQYVEGLDALLDVLRQDRNFGEGAARQAMLAVFELLGNENPLVPEYRRKLANILF